MTLFMLLVGCTTQTSLDFPTCQVDLLGLEPASASVGQEVTLTGRPLTVDWDTAVRVGGVDALVDAVLREGCETCDACLETEGCSVCDEDCDVCDAECKADCVETVSFFVPELPLGQATVELFNAHGHSERLVLEVVEASGDSGDSAR